MTIDELWLGLENDAKMAGTSAWLAHGCESRGQLRDRAQQFSLRWRWHGFIQQPRISTNRHEVHSRRFSRRGRGGRREEDFTDGNGGNEGKGRKVQVGRGLLPQ